MKSDVIFIKEFSYKLIRPYRDTPPERNCVKTQKGLANLNIDSPTARLRAHSESGSESEIELESKFNGNRNWIWI